MAVLVVLSTRFPVTDDAIFCQIFFLKIYYCLSVRSALGMKHFSTTQTRLRLQLLRLKEQIRPAAGLRSGRIE